jgi:hypothetical protein
MKRTSVGFLIGLAAMGFAVAYLGQLLVQTTGGVTIVPPISLEISLIVIAIAIVGMALPVRRRVTGKRKQPLDPFYAVRVAVLAKASALTGAILLGAGAGMLLVLLSRPILPSWGLLMPAIGLVACSLVLIVAGLVAEWMCVLPPDKPENDSTKVSGGKDPGHEPAT